MIEEPTFPQPEGPGTGPLTSAPENGDGEGGTKKIWTPGADGFAQETTFIIDQSTPGATIVDSSDPTDIGAPLLDWYEAIVPAGRNGQFTLHPPGMGPRALGDNAILGARFELARPQRVSNMTIFMGVPGTTIHTVDFGIYNATATQLLASTGSTVIPNGPPAFPRPARLPLLVPVNLTAGTEYILAVLGIAVAGANAIIWGPGYDANWALMLSSIRDPGGLTNDELDVMTLLNFTCTRTANYNTLPANLRVTMLDAGHAASAGGSFGGPCAIFD